MTFVQRPETEPFGHFGSEFDERRLVASVLQRTRNHNSWLICATGQELEMCFLLGEERYEIGREEANSIRSKKHLERKLYGLFSWAPHMYL
jgi:hypothetical protein